jgi:hypothetical protein
MTAEIIALAVEMGAIYNEELNTLDFCNVISNGLFNKFLKEAGYVNAATNT